MHFADTDKFITKNGTRFEMEPTKNLFIWQMLTSFDIECNAAKLSEEKCFAISFQR